MRVKNYLLIVFATSIFLSYLLPNHYAPWLSFHQEALAAFAFIVILPYYWGGEAINVPFGNILIFFAALPVVQYGVGIVDYFGDAIICALYFLGFYLVYMMGVRARWSVNLNIKDKVLNSLFLGILFASLLSVGIALHQTLGLQRFSVWLVETPAATKAVGNLAQSNHLASLLFLGLVALDFLYKNKKINKYLLLIGQIYLSVGLAAAGSRTTFVVFLSIIVLALYYLRVHRVSLFPMVGRMAFALLMGYFFYYEFIDYYHMRDPHTSVDVLTSMDSGRVRLAYINIALRAIKDAPILGYGVNQVVFLNEYVKGGEYVTYTYFNSVHNLFLDLFIWLGLPLGVFFVFSFGRELRAIFLNGRSEMGFILMTGVLVVFVHSMLEYPYRYAYFLLPIGFFMGYLRAKPDKSLSSMKLISQGGDRTFFVIGCFAVLAVLALILEYFPYESEWSDLAYREAKIGNQPPRNLPSVYALTNLSSVTKIYRMHPSEYLDEDNFKDLKKVARHNPTGQILMRLANAQFQRGDYYGYDETMKIYCSTRRSNNCYYDSFSTGDDKVR
ncbi:PglL family O-oligosaccharyltransferase [Rhodoferax bucti]|uniref:PglL family O-oligosaccharyltransferase n=1 Tax=Rhodoferax bucti TaxID=2576305 RepID=UPI001107B8AC|nr:O-antigen ligase family protein [Rhodoferax bucti]